MRIHGVCFHIHTQADCRTVSVEDAANTGNILFTFCLLPCEVLVTADQLSSCRRRLHARSGFNAQLSLLLFR